MNNCTEKSPKIISHSFHVLQMCIVQASVHFKSMQMSLFVGPFHAYRESGQYIVTVIILSNNYQPINFFINKKAG